MLRKYSIAEARNHFTTLVHDVEQASVIELTRRGKPVAVLLSIQEYRRLSTGQTGFWNAYATFQDSINLQKLNIEPDIFKEARDVSPGRKVNW